jgi:hypothetical protein
MLKLILAVLAVVLALLCLTSPAPAAEIPVESWNVWTYDVNPPLPRVNRPVTLPDPLLGWRRHWFNPRNPEAPTTVWMQEYPKRPSYLKPVPTGRPW